LFKDTPKDTFVLNKIKIMKITITGSLGHVSKPLAVRLIRAGHTVTIISSNASRTAEIEALGGIAAIGTVADVAFLTGAFTDADVVYTMVPPDFSVPDMIAYFSSTGKNYAAALMAAGVNRVVNLSSMGAHLNTQVGLIAGAYFVEQALSALDNVIHLRAPFFYYNFYNNAAMIKQGFMGSNYPADTRMLLVHHEDLAAAAAEEIQRPFSGRRVRYVVSDTCSASQVVSQLGNALEQELAWVEFSDADTLQGMVQGGMPEHVAKLFVETGTAVRSGILWEEYDKKTVKMKGFAKEFANNIS
jgi:uncharacterized protein YbjT (DUF2867 family)